MRTKTLLLTAALCAAGVATSLAQVYSVNAVGYVNLSLPAGYSLIANPLNNGSNHLKAVLTGVPDAAVVYQWTGAAFDNDPPSYIDGVGWLNSVGPADDTVTLAPGAGFFLYLPAASTVTFVGEVPQGTLTQNVPTGYSIQASQVPQAGTLTALGFSAKDGDTVYQWIRSSQGYDANPPTFIEGGVGWIPQEPTIGVGEGFFLYRTGTAGTWTRTFSVNN